MNPMAGAGGCESRHRGRTRERHGKNGASLSKSVNRKPVAAWHHINHMLFSAAPGKAAEHDTLTLTRNNRTCSLEA